MKVKSNFTKQTTAHSEKPVSAAKKTIESHWPAYFLGGILVLVLLAYINMLRNEILTFDDNDYFQMYPEVTRLSWESVKQYFSNHYLIMYQPLPVLTFALNYHFTGLDTYPMHWVNLLFHLGNVVLVYLFAGRLTNNRWIGAITALLFGIHPMNVEAVTWISARSSGMYTFFYLAALIQYLKYLKEDNLKPLLLTGLFFVLSLFSKAQAVTLPVVMLLLDFYFNRNLKSPKTWLEKIPFFALSIVFGLITLSDTDTMRNITEGMMISYTLPDMIFMLSYSIVFYLFKLFLPVSLCAVYVYPPKTGGWLPWEYYASLPLLAGLLWLLWKHRGKRWVVLCAGLFLTTISINLQIIPSRLFIVTERYGYFPYIGLFLMVLMALDLWKRRQPFIYQKRQPMLIGVLTLFSIASVAGIYNRNQVWKSDIPFLTDIIEKNPEVPYLYRAYGNRGMAYKVRGQLPEALQDFSKAISINSTDARSFYNRALVHIAMNNNGAALTDLDEALKRDSSQWMLYRDRSQIRLLSSDTSGAQSDALQLLRMQPSNPDAFNVLATIAYNRIDLTMAENYLNEALLANPDFSLGYKNRGLLYLRLGRTGEGCSDFQRASNLGNQEAKQLFMQYCK